MPAAKIPRSTTGLFGVWNGTNDGEEGYIDYGTGTANVNDPKEVEVELFDIRSMEEADKPTFKKVGYEFATHKTELTTEQLMAGLHTEDGKRYIEDVYFKETAEIIQKHTDGAIVVPYTFRVRENTLVRPAEFAAKNLAKKGIANAVLPVAHVGRDMETAPPRLRDIFGDKTDELVAKYKRYASINVWRPIGDTVKRWPLCMINHEGIPDWNYDTHCARVYPRNDPRVSIRGAKSHDLILKWDPRYVCHYASDMTPDDVFIFSSFDSDQSKVAPHAAFWDNSTPDDAPIRRSIEVRTWVFFE
ncbi:hypothetical protein DL768_004810 [Monosporascus sp. mg162]|nr:hypothetical protein DL768_004810 [Monosporascus sp. mg162]